MPVELSVIIPARNAAGTLVDQLDALVRQRDAPAFEVIVSDNGSHDETREITVNYGTVHPFIRWVDASDRLSASYARNAGAAAATAQALAFCDADDIVGSHWVRAMGEALRDHTMVTGPMEYDSLNKPWLIEARGRAQVDDFLYIRGGPAMPFCFSANLGVQAAWHHRVGGFDELMSAAGEDADYLWRLQREGGTLSWEPAALVHYRLRGGMRGLFRQMRSYTAGHHSLYERHADIWPFPPPTLDTTTVRRNALKRLWWIRGRRGLGIWVRGVGWESGYVVGDADPTSGGPEGQAMQAPRQTPKSH